MKRLFSGIAASIELGLFMAGVIFLLSAAVSFKRAPFGGGSIETFRTEHWQKNFNVFAVIDRGRLDIQTQMMTFHGKVAGPPIGAIDLDCGLAPTRSNHGTTIQIGLFVPEGQWFGWENRKYIDSGMYPTRNTMIAVPAPIIAIPLSAFGLWRIRQRRKRGLLQDTVNNCKGCGYKLIEITNDTCPECGHQQVTVKTAPK